MKIDKYSIDGNIVGQIELPEDVFGADVNDVLIYDLIRAMNANSHQGTHKTKERSEIRGGGVKPWKQKGTGRARAGSSRSPIWRGGGTVFGPRPRSYRIELPRKVKQAAYRSLFSLKAKQGTLKVIEDFDVQGKTKEMATIAKKLSVNKGLLITDNESLLLKRSMKNLPNFFYNNVKRISGKEIFNCKDLVITEGAVKVIKETYSKVAK